MSNHGKDEKTNFFDEPRNVKGFLILVFVISAILLLLDFVIHKHPYFESEEWFGFYSVFGFVAFVCIVFAAKYILRPLVKRDEDYYDR